MTKRTLFWAVWALGMTCCSPDDVAEPIAKTVGYGLSYPLGVSLLQATLEDLYYYQDHREQYDYPRDSDQEFDSNFMASFEQNPAAVSIKADSCDVLAAQFSSDLELLLDEARFQPLTAEVKHDLVVFTRVRGDYFMHRKCDLAIMNLPDDKPNLVADLIESGDE